MSDLISREALLEALKDNGTYLLPDGADESDYIYYSEAVDLITNAPAIGQGEPVGRLEITKDEFGFYFSYSLPNTVEGGFGEAVNAISIDAWMQSFGVGKFSLYTAPPQPQEQNELVRKAVKDALEKATSICDDRAKYMKEMIMQDVVVGKADTGAMVCANAIRALIEKE